MSQKFCNILVVRVSLRRGYHVVEAVQAVVGSIVVASVLICGALRHSVCDLKAAQMNVQWSLNRDIILFEFELDHNVLKATKNICCAKGLFRFGFFV